MYCVSCFAKMKKWPVNYHVISKLEFPVLEDSWTALEEIYVFEGLEKYLLLNIDMDLEIGIKFQSIWSAIKAEMMWKNIILIFI